MNVEIVKWLINSFFQFLKITGYGEKKLIDIFELNPNNPPTATGNYFRLYLKNITKNDLDIYLKVKVELNNELMRKDLGYDGVLLPIDQKIEAYQDRISDILQNNLTGRNLSDPKDNKEQPLFFTVFGTINYKILGILPIKEDYKSVWECINPDWKCTIPHWKFRKIKENEGDNEMKLNPNQIKTIAYTLYILSAFIIFKTIYDYNDEGAIYRIDYFSLKIISIIILIGLGKFLMTINKD